MLPVFRNRMDAYVSVSVAVDVDVLNSCLEYSISNIGIELNDSASVKVLRRGLNPAATFEHLLEDSRLLYSQFCSCQFAFDNSVAYTLAVFYKIHGGFLGLVGGSYFTFWACVSCNYTFFMYCRIRH